MANSLNYKWTIFCDTEGQNIVVSQKSRPLVCPNNSEHVLLHEKSKYDIEILPPIITDITKNIGYYTSEGISFTCNALSTTTHNIVFPYDITLCNSSLHVSPSNEDDKLSIILAPDLDIGVIIQPVSIGDTILYITNPSLEYCVKGMYLTIDSEIVCIKSVDLTNSTLILTSPFTDKHVAGTHTYRNIYITKDIHLHQGVLVLGKSNPYPSYIPAGISFDVKYTNTENTSKIFNMIIEYY